MLTNENWTWIIWTRNVTSFDKCAVVQCYVNASLQLSQQRSERHTHFYALLKLKHALLWVQLANVGYALVAARCLNARSFCLKFNLS
jgi:hypothetical protein